MHPTLQGSADLTVPQKVLVAAHSLESKGFSPFTAEALAVAAYELDNKLFGLRGFEARHLDCNRVYSTVMGARGLAARGWLVKVGQKLYSMSRQGKEEARRVLAGDSSPLPKRRALMKIQVPKDLEARLVSMLTSTAFRRFEEGMRSQITYRDAKAFWRLSDLAVGSAVDLTVGTAEFELASVEQLLIGDSIELSIGQCVHAKDLKQLLALHAFLREQFAKNLARQREGG